MKVRFYRWYNAVLTALLSMLGYGCSSDEPDMYGTPVMEYGTPYATYRVEGTVTDEANNPVQGIKASIKVFFTNDGKVNAGGVDSILTDAAGSYRLTYMGMDRPDYKLTVEDTDGEANGGEFLSDTLDIDFGRAVKVKNGDGAWNGGEYMIQQPVRLKKKP